MNDGASSSLAFLAHTGFPALASRAYSLFVSLLSGVLIARTIGAADYGLFSLCRSLCETLLVFVKSGYDLGLVRYIPEAVSSGNREKAIWFIRLTIMVVIVTSMIPVLFLALGGSAWLESHVYRYEGFRWVMTAMSLLIPLAAVMQVLGGAFSGFMIVTPRTLVEFIVQPTARLVIILALFTLNWSLWATVTGTVMSYLIGVGILILIGTRTIFKDFSSLKVSITLAIKELVSVGKYSSVLALSMSISLLLQRLDTLMLGYYVDASMVGSYAVVQMMSSILTIANASLGQGLGPLVSNLYQRGETREMMRIMQHHTRWTVMLTLPLGILLSSMGDTVIGLFGRDYSVAPGVLIALIYAQVISAVTSSCGYTLSMTGRHNQELRLLTIGLIVNAGLNLLLIPSLGMLGAALASLSAIAIANMLRICFIFKIYNVSPIGADVLRPITIAIACFAPIYLLIINLSNPPSPLAMAGFMAGYLTLYVGATMLLGLTSEDRKLGAKILLKLRIKS